MIHIPWCTIRGVRSRSKLLYTAVWSMCVCPVYHSRNQYANSIFEGELTLPTPAEYRSTNCHFLYLSNYPLITKSHFLFRVASKISLLLSTKVGLSIWQPRTCDSIYNKVFQSSDDTLFFSRSEEKLNAISEQDTKREVLDLPTHSVPQHNVEFNHQVSCYFLVKTEKFYDFYESLTFNR